MTPDILTGIWKLTNVIQTALSDFKKKLLSNAKPLVPAPQCTSSLCPETESINFFFPGQNSSLTLQAAASLASVSKMHRLPHESNAAKLNSFFPGPFNALQPGACVKDSAPGRYKV